MRIGRYRIYLGRYVWLQTHHPVTVRRFLCFTIVKKARPTDTDKTQQFPLGYPMVLEGRKYRYWRAKENIPKDSIVASDIEL